MRGANFTRVARRLLGMWVLCACAAATSAHAEPVIQARLDRSSIQSGESATLVVSVEGADGTGSFDAIWATPTLPDKDYCEGLQEQLVPRRTPTNPVKP